MRHEAKGGGGRAGFWGGAFQMHFKYGGGAEGEWGLNGRNNLSGSLVSCERGGGDAGLTIASHQIYHLYKQGAPLQPL